MSNSWLNNSFVYRLTRCLYWFNYIYFKVFFSSADRIFDMFNSWLDNSLVDFSTPFFYGIPCGGHILSPENHIIRAG